MTAACAREIQQEWVDAVEAARDAVYSSEVVKLLSHEEGECARHALRREREWVLGFPFGVLFLSPRDVQDVSPAHRF